MKKIIIISVIAIVVGVVIYFAYKHFKKPTTEKAIDAEIARIAEAKKKLIAFGAVQKAVTKQIVLPGQEHLLVQQQETRG
jgi:hypothetical protein